MYARPEEVQTKVQYTILQFPVVTYDKGFLRCAIHVVRMVVVLFSLFKQYLETESSKSPPIFVRECIFKNQN